MNSMTTVINNSAIPAKLVRAVVRQLGGTESMSDIARYGIDGGFNGFIYYCDTIAFFKRNRKEIVELAERYADDFSTNAIDLIAGFNCLKPADAETKRSIARCLYGGRLTDDDTQVANALAWFAAEEVAREFDGDYE